MTSATAANITGLASQTATFRASASGGAQTVTLLEVNGASAQIVAPVHTGASANNVNSGVITPPSGWCLIVVMGQGGGVITNQSVTNIGTASPTWTVIKNDDPSIGQPGLVAWTVVNANGTNTYGVNYATGAAAGTAVASVAAYGTVSNYKNLTGAAAGVSTVSVAVSYAAPKLVAAGTFVSTATNAATLAPGLPSGWAANDIHILIAGRKDTTAMTALSGWTQYAGLTGNNSTTLRTEVWWRRAVAGDTAPTVTYGSGTVLRWAQIIGFRGCNPAADPVNLSSRLANASSATVSTTGITPTAAPTLVCSAVYLSRRSDHGDTTTRWLDDVYGHALWLGWRCTRLPRRATTRVQRVRTAHRRRSPAARPTASTTACCRSRLPHAPAAGATSRGT